MSDVLQFIWAVAEHWQALLTGGLLMAILGIIERRKEKPLPWKAFRWIAMAALVVAFYMAWHDEHSARLQFADAAKNVSETAALRTRVLTMIRELKAFQLERREVEVAANGTWQSEEETRKLFLQRFSSPLGKLAMELPQSLADEGRLIKESADTPSGGGSRSLEPLLSLLQSVSASL